MMKVRRAAEKAPWLANGAAASRGAPRSTAGSAVQALRAALVMGLALLVALGPIPPSGAAGAATSGDVRAWGDNFAGQLGDGTTAGSALRVQSSISGVEKVKGGRYHSLALKKDGTVWAWGRNADGQLGDGTTTDRITRVEARNLGGVVAIAAGSLHSLAVK
jgi:hypothetical protein